MLIRKHQYLLTTIKSFIVTHNLSIHIYSLQINGGHFVDPFDPFCEPIYLLILQSYRDMTGGWRLDYRKRLCP